MYKFGYNCNKLLSKRLLSNYWSYLHNCQVLIFLQQIQCQVFWKNAREIDILYPAIWAQQKRK